MAEAEPPAKPRTGKKSPLAAMGGVLLSRLKVLLPLAIATILMLVGFFLLWQSSLVYSESGSVAAALRKGARAANRRELSTRRTTRPDSSTSSAPPAGPRR